jgi:hypothetical protein
MKNCIKCNEPISGNYCSNCGQPAQLKRIDGKYMIREIGDFLFANKGMVYTLKRIIINPGAGVREFLTEDRYRFVKPVTFVIFTSLIYTIVNHYFPLDLTSFVPQGADIDLTTQITNWIQANPGYVNLIIGGFMAFGVKLVFRKSGYNIFEIYILLCYVFGISSLFDSVFAILQSVTHLNLLVLSFIGFLYVTWAVGQFFDRKKATSYIKASLSYIVGYLLLMFLSGCVGFIWALFNMVK